MIQTIQARKLCSESEWADLESSFSPAVEALPPSDLKGKLGRVRKLLQKSVDLVDRQHSDARKLTTRRKTELFLEAIGRFEAALTLMEKAHRTTAVSKDLDNERIPEESHVLSSMAVRGEQQGGKSGSRRTQSHVGSATHRQQKKRDAKNH
jgi:hypothetical protein